MSDIELLKIVSFCVLMQNGEGIMGKAPSYISEKARLLRSPFDMYTALDSLNSSTVLKWGKEWGIDFKTLVKQIQDDHWNIPLVEFRKKYAVEG